MNILFLIKMYIRTRESSSLHSQSNNGSLGVGLRSLKKVGVKIWNNIPKSIRLITNFTIFKNKIKKFISVIFHSFYEKTK